MHLAPNIHTRPDQRILHVRPNEELPHVREVEHIWRCGLLDPRVVVQCLMCAASRISVEMHDDGGLANPLDMGGRRVGEGVQ